MVPSTLPLAAEKDLELELEIPTGHPAFNEPATPFMSPAIRTQATRCRYYQQFPPDLDKDTLTRSASDAAVFDTGSKEVECGRNGAKVLEKVRRVLGRRRR